MHIQYLLIYVKGGKSSPSAETPKPGAGDKYPHIPNGSCQSPTPMFAEKCLPCFPLTSSTHIQPI